MRSSLIKVPLLLAALASAHHISITIPSGQKGLQEGLAGSDCFWGGVAPFCAYSCNAAGYQVCQTSNYGDGECCWTGHKSYCCKTCSAVLPALDLGHGRLHAADGPHDDYCPPGQHILCPPQAKHNDECVCLDDEAVKLNHQKRPGL